MNELVFIGHNMDKSQLLSDLQNCLITGNEEELYKNKITIVNLVVVGVSDNKTRKTEEKIYGQIIMRKNLKKATRVAFNVLKQDCFIKQTCGCLVFVLLS